MAAANTVRAVTTAICTIWTMNGANQAGKFIRSRQIPICCSLFVFKLYHKTCEHFYRNFGLYEKSPNSFLPGLPRSIINQFRFHNLLCLCLASVHLPHPFHLVFGFQPFGHAVLLCQLWHDQFHAASCRFVNLGAMLKELVE